MDRKKLLLRLVLLIFFIFAFNFLAGKFYWYSSIWWFDMPMHFMGGLWLGLMAIYLLRPVDLSVSLIFKILLLVLIVGTGWEVFEVLVDKFITQNTFNSLDTVSDICFDLSGGLCAILYLWKKQSK